MPSSEPVFATPLTKVFKINHPVMLAGELQYFLLMIWARFDCNSLGMNVAAGPKLAAAVTNAG